MCPPHSCLQSQTLWTLNEDRKPWKTLHKMIMLIAVLMSPLSHWNYSRLKPGRYSSSQERSVNFRHSNVDMEKTFWTRYPLIGTLEIIFQISIITPFIQKAGSDHILIALEKPCNCTEKGFPQVCYSALSIYRTFLFSCLSVTLYTLETMPTWEKTPHFYFPNQGMAIFKIAISAF